MPVIRPFVNEFASAEPIVVVSGLPRSGTSMMMQMLKAGGLPVLTDGIREADEDNPRGYYEFEKVKQTKRDASWLHQANGKVVKVVHALLSDLPTDRPYYVIMMRRHIDEVLDSQSAMLARLGKQGASLPAEKLARIFATQMDDAMSYLREQSCFEALEVWYDKVLSNAPACAEQVNDFLSGDLDTVTMASAVDPRLSNQRA